MHRRYFLNISILGGAALASPLLGLDPTGAAAKRRIMTVSGYIDAASLGTTLPHEHIFTDFAGAQQVTPQYGPEQGYEFAFPYLKKIKAQAIRTIVECTPNYIGRDAALLKRLSKASGLQIITNTGYYAAVNFKYLPPHAHTATVEQLAARWISEWENGISDTGVRPGFIKLGVGNAPLAPVERKLIEAAAITHLQTGLKIYIHTGNAQAAIEEADLLESKGGHPAAMVWVHAQNDQTGDYHLQLARRGCWISLDNYSIKERDRYITYLKKLKEASLLNKVLLSHDNGFAVVNKNGQISFEPFGATAETIYSAIQTDLKPALLKAGFSPEDLDLVMRLNPANALTIEVLKAG